MEDKVYSVIEKKVLKLTGGYGLFITPEAKKFGWDNSTKIRVSATEGTKGKRIIVEEA